MQETVNEISNLLASMASRRKVLLGILAFCATRRSVAAVEAEVTRLERSDASVYTAANYCAFLERAGALQRVTADDTPFVQAVAEPVIVVEEGVEYLRPGDTPEAFWLITPAGATVLANNNPQQQLVQLFEVDAPYLPLYQRIFALCAANNGSTTKALSAAVDSDPLVQKPRLYVQRFIDRLEKCGALEWSTEHKAWQTTALGRFGQDLLAQKAEAHSQAHTHQQNEEAAAHD